MSGYERFFIVSGGPGAGKTTLLQALQQQGVLHTQEAGRAIIQEQMAFGGQALPWADRVLFAEAMLKFEMASYRWAVRQKGIVLFDRGMPDVMGYLQLSGLPIPPSIRGAVRRYGYNRMVFLCPPWKEIFGQDQQRKQNFDEAVRTFDVMEALYRALGADVHYVPKSTVNQRVAYIRQKIGL